MASHRLPIFQDDVSFRDRRDNMFKDMGPGWDRPFGRLGNLDDDFDKMCKDFFELRPRANPKLGKIRRDDFGSHESLDDDAQRTLFRENPETKGRLFEMSFDVKGFEPSDISLRVQGDTLLVEAKHVTEQGGSQNIKEFSRNIKIPKEVDPEKLQSRISNDGILSIQAPVPPKYSSIAPGSSQTYVRQGSSPQSFSPGQRQSYGDDLYTQKLPSASTGTGSPYVQQTSRPYSPQYTADEPRKTFIPQQPSRPAPQRTNSEYDNQPMSPGGPQTSVHYRPDTRSPPSVYSTTSTPYSPGIDPPGYSQAQAQPRYTASVSFQPPNPPPQQDYEDGVTLHPVKTCVMDQPLFSQVGQGRRMDLSLMLGDPYTPDDIVVKVDGRTLQIEATHEEKKDKATSKTSMSREFDLAEDIDPNTVQANLTSDGRLKICANVIPPKQT